MKALAAMSVGMLVGVGATAGARACEIDPCFSTYAAPASGVVPANAPALFYSPPPGTSGAPEANLLLLTGDGSPLAFTSEPDPATSGGFLVRPPRPSSKARPIDW
jgi:hypothetical protein